MGTIIAFPEGGARRASGRSLSPGEMASVVILPVIRIERHGDDTSDGAPDGNGGEQGTGGGRRRRLRS